MIRVIVVDDHPVVCEGLAAILGDQPEFRVLAQVLSGEEALLAAERHRFDVAVIDARLPGLSGAETCRALLALYPTSRVVILTSFPNEGVMLTALDAGAAGFLVKESDPTILLRAVRAVAAGERYIDPKLAAKFAALTSEGRRLRGPHNLTPQEMRVLELLPRGLTNREIGLRLTIGEQTVKTHLHHAMRKLGAHDRAEAASIAVREGLA